MSNANKMSLSEPQRLSLNLSTGSGRTVQSDHAQNDSTKSDYIKNRIAYYCRKFDDIEAVEYTEQVVATLTIEEEEIYSAPFFLKFSELLENATPKEIIDELIGMGVYGEEMRIDDPEVFTDEIRENIGYKDFYNEAGEYIGSCLTMEETPHILAINADDVTLNYPISYENDSGIVEGAYLIHFPEKGIYTILLDVAEDENGIEKYLSFDKILFRDAVRLDKELLPPEALSPSIEVDDHPEKWSENPITSGAVYDLNATHENRMTNIETNHNSLHNVVNGHTTTIATLSNTMSKKMPNVAVSTADNGKILMVVNGSWQAVEIPYAEEEAY